MQRGTKRSAESDPATVAPPSLRDDEPLLFDALVGRADCMLNPLASARQLMVNDVLQLIRQRVREPLLCMVENRDSKVFEYNLCDPSRDVSIRRVDQRIATTEFVPWRNGWIGRSDPVWFCNVTRYHFVPADGSSSFETHGAPDWSNNGSAVDVRCDGDLPFISLICRSGTSTIQAKVLRQPTPACEWSSPIQITSARRLRWYYHTVAVEDSRCVMVNYFHGRGDVQLVELSAGACSLLGVHTGLDKLRPLRVNQNVAELWNGNRCVPARIYDLRARSAVRLPEKRPYAFSSSSFDCTNIDENLAACVGNRRTSSSSVNSKCLIYDRRACRHCIEYPTELTKESRCGLFLRNSEPLNC